MNREEVHTTLRFVGDWPWWAGAGLAALLGVAAWWLYYREVGGLGWALRWSLPALRGGAVAMITLMLAGPILHHRRIIGELSQLFIFVDGSRSMDRPDPSMPLGRKILVLQRLGLLPPGTVNMELSQAAEALAEAKAGAERAQSVPRTDTAGWDQMVSDLLAKIREAQKRVAQTGEPARSERLGREIVDPMVALAERELEQSDDRRRAIEDLARLGERSGRWQRELESAFEKEVGAQASTEGSALKGALELFGNLPRWQRLQSMLLEGAQEKLLARLAQTHDVQLLALNTTGSQNIWQPSQRSSTLPAELPKPTGENTNLAGGLKALGSSSRTQNARGAIVLLSDGQHNTGESPVEVAKILGGRQLPIFPVGFGSQVRPEDLAILSIDGPGAVFYQDRIRGQVTLKDDIPAGQPFTLAIKTGEKVVWEQKFLTENKPQRKIPFDFALHEIVQARLQNRQSQDVQVSGFPLDFQVSVSLPAADREPGNNAGSLRVRALTQKRKLLILDGRPRWEVRYLRNLFERDEQWEVNAVIAGTSAGQAGFVRGGEPGQFPKDAALLQPYDLIVFGEVPRAVFRNEELEWIKKFVAERGGALIFIDGARGRFKEYGDTAIGPLFPVEWKAGEIRGGIERLALNERGQQLAPFALAPDRAENAEVWRALLPPHWLSGAEPLPGAETLLEAEVQGQRKPAVVYRPFGAGRVLYQAFDDSWRWRHEVADRYHVKYWNQMASWVAELPF
nr:VWA domain-containing protein [Verrucomicrobiota bacterium]